MIQDVSFSGVTNVPDAEFSARKARVFDVLEQQGLDAFVFFSADAIFYLTGCSLFQTERPIVYLLSARHSMMLVPTLELEHAQDSIRGCAFTAYPEYPGLRHPMQYLADMLSAAGLSHARMAADASGYPAVKGYRGPSLSEVCPDIRLTLMPGFIAGLRMHKSEFEIRLMRESARWGQYGHSLLQRYTRAGANEIAVAHRATAEAAQTMLDTLGPGFRLCGYDGDGAFAGFRGQIGAHSAFPHACTTNARFRHGDTVVTYSEPSILGYHCELERTLFVGEPSAEQQRLYALSVAAQNAAFEMIRPGVACSEVDRALMRFFEEHAIMEYWRHHSGHGIGVGLHEAPFLDVGDQTVLEPGMCITVEPGLYVRGLGGFRLSDTIVITAAGFERLTYYPRDIASLICI